MKYKELLQQIADIIYEYESQFDGNSYEIDNFDTIECFLSRNGKTFFRYIGSAEFEKDKNLTVNNKIVIRNMITDLEEELLNR